MDNGESEFAASIHRPHHSSFEIERQPQWGSGGGANPKCPVRKAVCGRCFRCGRALHRGLFMPEAIFGGFGAQSFPRRSRQRAGQGRTTPARPVRLRGRLLSHTRCRQASCSVQGLAARDPVYRTAALNNWTRKDCPYMPSISRVRRSRAGGLKGQSVSLLTTSTWGPVVVNFNTPGGRVTPVSGTGPSGVIP